MMPGPEFVFHIGAHKTATTFMQHVFAANQQALFDKGILYVDHREFRKAVTLPCQSLSHVRAGVDWQTEHTEEEALQLADSMFDAFTMSGAKTVLISEENFAGHSGHLVRNGILYNRKGRFFNTYREVFPSHAKKFFLAIRGYAEFFSSAYSQFLLDVIPQRFVYPEHTANLVMERYPSWNNFAQFLLKSFPDSEVYVWRYEDFKADHMKVFSKMVGQDVARALDIEVAPRNRRAAISQKRLNGLLKSIDELGLENALPKFRNMQKRRKLIEEKQRPMSVFNKEQVSVLEQRYRKHCEQLTKADSRIKTLF